MAQHGGEGHGGAAGRRILVDAHAGGEESGAHGVVPPALAEGPHEAVIGPIGEHVGGDVAGALESMDLVGKRHLGDPRGDGSRHARPLDRWQVGDLDARRVVVGTVPWHHADAASKRDGAPGVARCHVAPTSG